LPIRNLIFLTIFFSSLVFCQSSNIDYNNTGDKLFFSLDYDKAIEIYKNGLMHSPNDYDLNWKLARVYVNYGEVPGNEKKNYFTEAKKYAEKGMKLNPKRSEGYTFAAAAIGNIAFYAGNKEKLAASNQMLILLHKAIELNSEDHIAFSILGSLERMFANLSWFERTLAGVIYSSSVPKGNYENALKYFEKAIAVDSKLIRHHYELALTYIDMKDYQHARSEFEKTLTCPIMLKADYRRIELTKEKLNQIGK
jgi:tetratricopeptide (TPR) repeat protein